MYLFIQRGFMSEMKIILSTTANQQLPYIQDTHIKEWIPLISERAFVMWLSLIIQVTDKKTPATFNELATSHNMTSDELETNIIEPLYSVGLLDIEYLQINDETVQKIVIHPFPFNNIKRVNNLSKVRQYRKKVEPIKKVSLKLNDVLVKHHNKLWNDGIDKAVIKELFKEEQSNSSPLTEHEFSELIDSVLTKSKTKIGSKGNVYSYFKVVLTRHKEKILKSK